LHAGQTLFKEGLRLEKEGKTEEARKKFEQAAEKFEKANAMAFALKTYADLKRTGASQEFLDAVKNAAKAHIENVGQNNVEGKRSALMLLAANSYIDLHANGMFEQAALAKDFTISLKDKPAKEFEIARDQIAILQAMTGTVVPDEFRQEFLNKLGIAFSLYNTVDTSKPKEEIQKQLDKAALFTSAVLQLATYAKMPPEMREKLKAYVASLLQGFESNEITEALVAEIAFRFSQEIVNDLLTRTIDGMRFPKEIQEKINRIRENIKDLIENGEIEQAFQAIVYLNTYRYGAYIEAPFRNEQVLEYVTFLSGQIDEEHGREIFERCMPEFEKLNRYVQIYKEIENTRALFAERKASFAALERRDRTIFDYNKLEQQLNAALDLAKAGNFEQAINAVGAAHAAFVDIDNAAVQQARQIAIDTDIEGLEHFEAQIARYRRELSDKHKEFAPKIAGPNLYSTLSSISNGQLVVLEAQISVRLEELRRIRANPNAHYEGGEIIAAKARMQKFDEIVRYTSSCLDMLALINNLASDPALKENDRRRLIVIAGLVQNALEKIGAEPPNYERTKELLEQAITGIFSIAKEKTELSDDLLDHMRDTKINVLRNTLSGAYSNEEADQKGINYGLYIIDANISEALRAALTLPGEERNNAIYQADYHANLLYEMIESALANEINAKLSSHAFEQCMESFELLLQARSERNERAKGRASMSIVELSKIPSLPIDEHAGSLRAAIQIQTEALQALVAKKMGDHNARHRLFMPTETGTALLTDHKFQSIMDDIEGRYFANGEFILHVHAPSTFFAMSIKDTIRAVRGLRSRWNISDEREMQYQLFDMLANNLNAQRELVEYAITANRLGRTITSEEYGTKIAEIMRPCLEARHAVLVRDGDSENAERFANYLRDIDRTKGDKLANLRIQTEIGDALNASEQQEISGEMWQLVTDTFGGLIPGYTSITEYARTGRVGGWTIVLDAAAFIPFAGQATRAASGARAGVRAARTTTNVSRIGRAAAYAEAYSGRARLTLSELTGASGRWGTALDLSENISDISGMVLGGYYTGSTIYDDVSRRRQLGLRANIEFQQAMEALQAGLPVFLWGGMYISDRYAGSGSALNRELNPVVYINRFSSRVAPYVRRARGMEWTQADAALRFANDEFVESIKTHGLKGDNPNRAIRNLASEATEESYHAIRERIDSGLEKLGEDAPQEFRRLADERIELEIELREAAKRANDLSGTEKDGAIAEARALVNNLDENLDKWKQEIKKLRNNVVSEAIALENVPTGFPSAANEQFGTDMRVIVRAAIAEEDMGNVINSAHAKGEISNEEWAAFFSLPEDVRAQRVADVINRRYSDKAGFQPTMEMDPTLSKHGERTASARRQMVERLKQLEQDMHVRLVDESMVDLHKIQTMHYEIGGAEHTRALERIREQSFYERMDVKLKRLINDPRTINPDAKYVDYKLLALLSDEQTFMRAASDFAKTYHGADIASIDKISYLGAGCFNAAVRVDVTLANGQKKSIVIRGPGDASPDIAVNKLLREAGVNTFNSSDRNYEGVDMSGHSTYISVQDLIEGRRLEDVLDSIRTGALGHQEIEQLVRGYFDNLAVAHFFGLTDNHEGNFMIMPDGSFMRLDYGVHMSYGNGNIAINDLANRFIEEQLLPAMGKTKLDDNLKQAAREAFTKRWEQLQADRNKVESLMTDIVSRRELYTGNGDNSGAQTYDYNGNVTGRNGLRLITDVDIQRFRTINSQSAKTMLGDLNDIVGGGTNSGAVSPDAPTAPMF